MVMRKKGCGAPSLIKINCLVPNLILFHQSYFVTSCSHLPLFHSYPFLFFFFFFFFFFFLHLYALDMTRPSLFFSFFLHAKPFPSSFSSSFFLISSPLSPPPKYKRNLIPYIMQHSCTEYALVFFASYNFSLS